MTAIFSWVHRTLYNPKKILFLCSAFLVTSLLLNGSLYRLMKVRSEFLRLKDRIQLEKQSVHDVELQIKQAKDPFFIERQAKEHLELLEKDDLLFIFSEEK
jgi:cell division protein FtsB